MKTTLMIMAAGIGSRFGGGVKQLEPVGPNGELIIDYSIYDAMEAGFDDIVFVIRKEIEQDFKEVIGNRIEQLLPVRYVYQEVTDVPSFVELQGRTKPWGTVQAVLVGKDMLTNPFVVINADDYYGKEAFCKVHDFLTSVDVAARPMKLAMAGFCLKNTMSENGGVNRAICQVDEDGYLLKATETKNISKTETGTFGFVDEQEVSVDLDSIVSMNFWGFTPAVFPVMEERWFRFLEEWNPADLKAEYLLPTFVDQLLKDKLANVRVLTSSDHWFGVTYREDKQIVVDSFQKLIEDDIYPSPLR